MTDDKEKLNLDDLAGAADTDGLEIEADDDNAWLDDQVSNSGNRDPVEQLEAIYNVPVQISVVLGKASMPISQLIKLGRGAVLELDRKVGESVDIVVNNRLIARGEVVVMDERVGITMTEIIKNQE